MSTATQPIRSLGREPEPPRIGTDGMPAGGPFPRMSARAGVIARALGIFTLLAWLAASEPQLRVLLALVIPLWIGAELVVHRLHRRHTRHAAA